MKKLFLSSTAFALFLMPYLAMAQEGMGTGTEPGGMFFIAKALAIGLAALGGALGQGKLVASALEGIARNPGASGQLFTPMILGVAFVESLVIFALVVAFTM